LSDAARYARHVAPGVSALVDESVPPATAEIWLSGCDSWFGDGRVALPELPGKVDVALVAVDGQRFVAKRAALRASVRLGLRADKLARAFVLGRELEDAGGPVPRPLALLELDGPPPTSCTVSPFVDAPSLARVIERGEVGAADDLLRRLAIAARAIHDAGFRHRDLKAPNLLVTGDATGVDERGVVVVDLDGLERVRGDASARVRVRDLGRLAASLRTAAARDAGFGDEAVGRLLAEYGAPELLERVIRWAVAKERRNAARGRPLL
jgi:hypothetical protein